MAEILTVKEIATYVGVTERTVYTWMAEKKIPGIKIGGSWRCRKKILDEWIDNNHKKGQK